uniref:SPRY domain-containing protein n=2 Tax=Meloidogyne incognita TaxID=6306 RepID=A0A914NID3_MELIC
MTEEVPTSVLELILNQSNYLLELQTNFNKEKEKNFNFEKKILENELKEMKEKIQKLESDHKNEIEASKEGSNQAVVLETETVNDISLNHVNNQKDKKINCLEKQIKEAEQKIGDLTIKFEQLNNITCKVVCFVENKNKWKFISDNYKCCKNNCINTDKPNGNCSEGNGVINLINEENIKYINCVEGKDTNNNFVVHAENLFKIPPNCFNYSLFYFEVKCKIERRDSLYWIDIGLANNSKSFRFIARNSIIVNEKAEELKLSSFSWNDNDVFGCGLVCPPTIINEFPYIFFTQNGKQIGKALLLKDNYEYYKPYVVLRCCSVETNFGTNLERNPFIYDISKHFVCKEFY